MIKNEWRDIRELECECGITVKFNNLSSESFVNAVKTKQMKCRCNNA
jgi:hypothetical protein